MPVLTSDDATVEKDATGPDGSPAVTEVIADIDDSAEELEASTGTEIEKSSGTDGSEESDSDPGKRKRTASWSVPPALSSVRTRLPRNRRGVAVLAAFVALLVGSGVMGWQLWRQHELNQAAQEAQRAAASYAQVITSLDAAKIDDNFRDVLDGATGVFKDKYAESSTELREKMIAFKVATHGAVVASAVQDVSPDKVTVLLFVDQSVTNSQAPDPRIDRMRMRMTMEKVDGRWRASDIALP